MKEFIKQALSENGTPSSKRLNGSKMITTGCIITLMLAIKYGCSTCVETLTQTLIICGMSLLGVSKVMDAFTKSTQNDKEN